MRDIEITKENLLNILTENREKHREVFKAAMDGYAKARRERLEDELRQTATGPMRDLKILLTCPKDHTADYDRVIRMVQLHEGATLVLSETDVQQYIMDDWVWRRDWNRKMSDYAGATYTANYGEYSEDN